MLGSAANGRYDLLGAGGCTVRRTGGLIFHVPDPGRAFSPTASRALQDLLKRRLVVGQVLLDQLPYLNQLL